MSISETGGSHRGSGDTPGNPSLRLKTLIADPKKHYSDLVAYCLELEAAQPGYEQAAKHLDKYKARIAGLEAQLIRVGVWPEGKEATDDES